MPRLPAARLKSWVQSLFVAAGAPPVPAEAVADHLVEADLVGHDSHGVLRVPQYLQAIDEGWVVPAAEPRLVVDHATSAVLDGQRGFGQVAASAAMRLAAEKARAAGIAAVAARNCYHSGRLGSYTAWAARRGLIGIALVNAGGGGQSVVPFGGLSRRLATNPLSIAAPSRGSFPLVLDFATSVAPEGKIRAHYLQGRSVPEGWIVDADGQPTTEPARFYRAPGGALLPLGGSAGYKGFGLALMIDILAGALSGAGCCREEVVAPGDGILMIAIEISRFTSRAAFDEQVSSLVEYVGSCPAAPGFERVLVPGEREHACQLSREVEGIPLDDATWEALSSAAARLGVPQVGFDLFAPFGAPPAVGIGLAGS